MSGSLTPEARARILADMENGFHNDEILHRLLDDVEPRYRGIAGDGLLGAIAEVRRGFVRPRSGRPTVTAEAHAYRLARAKAAAETTDLRVIAQHYRLQSGTTGVGPNPSAAEMDNRLRHLRRLNARLRAE